MSRIFLLIAAIFIIQIIVVKSQQDVSVSPILPTNAPNPNDQPISLTYNIVNVGYDKGGIVGYSRNNFTASSGEGVRFIWVGQNTHSVVESTLENPCLKKQGGVDLGAHNEPFNNTILVVSSAPFVFFSDVSDDCVKGMYGGINLPSGYTWPTNLQPPPQQIFTTPLNPKPTPTPTGSMSIAAASAENTQGSSSSDSVSTYYLKESSFGIIIGSLMLISLYFNIVISN